MRHVLFILFLFLIVQSQGQYSKVPQQISDCITLPNTSSYYFDPTIIQSTQCIVTPISGGAVVLQGTNENILQSAKQVHLQPGFSVQNLQGNGNLNVKATANLFEVVVFTPENYTDGVPRYEKLELGIRLPVNVQHRIDDYFAGNPGINPYDPSAISVQADFYRIPLYNYDAINVIPPSFHEKKYGFYYSDYNRDLTGPEVWKTKWTQDTTSYPWRVRFAPTILGDWRVDIKVSFGNQVLTALPIFFKCISSSNKGYLVKGNNRQLKFETGDGFFAIGQNIAWPDPNYWCLNPTTPLGESVQGAFPAEYMQIQGYVSSLASNKGNFVRIISGCWFFLIEQKKLGDYHAHQGDMWEMDRLLDFCKEEGVYLDLVLQMHIWFEYSFPSCIAGDRYTWQTCPYKVELGLTNPREFFTNPQAKEYFKRRLRYIFSRWGYSTNIAVFEFLSELDNTEADAANHVPSPYPSDPALQGVFRPWHDEMGAFVRNDLQHNHHLLSTSYAASPTGADMTFYSPYLDVVSSHAYLANRNMNLVDRDNYATTNRDNYPSKPFIFGEMGLGGAAAEVEVEIQCNDISWHNNLWATSMMDSYGAGLNWFEWDNNAYRSNFNGIATFFAEVDFENENWEKMKWPDDGLILNPNHHTYSNHDDDYFECMYMKNDDGSPGLSDKAFGWVHNRSYYWWNLRSNPCVSNLISIYNSNSNPSDNINAPTDDDNIDYQAALNKKIKIRDLKHLRKYKIEWYNTTNNQLVSSEIKMHAFGPEFQITVPWIVNLTPYRDLYFKIYLNNSSFSPVAPDSVFTEFLEGPESLAISDVPQEKSTDFSFVLFPNPSDLNYIEVKSSKTVVAFEVLDLQGRVVLSDVNLNSDSFMVNLNALSKGTYLLKITDRELYSYLKCFVKL